MQFSETLILQFTRKTISKPVWSQNKNQCYFDNDIRLVSYIFCFQEFWRRYIFVKSLYLPFLVTYVLYIAKLLKYIPGVSLKPEVQFDWIEREPYFNFKAWKTLIWYSERGYSDLSKNHSNKSDWISSLTYLL